MLKKIIIIVLEFASGIAGNLVMGWIQQDTWSNAFTQERLLWTLGGMFLMTLIVAWLESERGLKWNWRWHRFWYLWNVLGNPDLRRWDKAFARLDLAARPTGASSAKITNEDGKENFIEVLKELVSNRQVRERRALILGEPGSGKSTGLERLTLELARAALRRFGFGRPTPVLVRLGDFQGGELLPYLQQEIRHSAKGNSGKLLGKGIDTLAEKGHLVLLFDALDEALGDRREAVLAELRVFLRSQAYAQVPVVITARTREDPSGSLGKMRVYEIQDLSREEVNVFIQAYKPPEQSNSDIEERLNKYKLLEAGALGRNPFWLRKMVESGVIRGRKEEILKETVDALLKREMGKPKAQRSWRRMSNQHEQINETWEGLSWLAFQMSVNEEVSVEEDKAVTVLSARIKEREHIVAEGYRPRDMLGLGRDAQILDYAPNPVRFRHRLLQEFLTACAWAVHNELLTKAFIKRAAPDTNWWETFLMLGGLISDPSELTRSVLGDGSDIQRLFLAVALWGGMKVPDEELKKELAEALVRNLRQGVTEKHKEAAIELSKIVGEEMMEILEEMLDVGEQGVKDGIVDILASIGNKNAARLLVAQFSDVTLTDHAQGALATIGEPAIDSLVQALHEEATYVRSSAVNSLVQMGEPAIPSLIEALQDDNTRTRQSAVEALGRIGGTQAAESLFYALKDTDQQVRLLAVDALVNIGDPLAIPSMATLQGESGNVRM